MATPAWVATTNASLPSLILSGTVSSEQPDLGLCAPGEDQQLDLMAAGEDCADLSGLYEATVYTCDGTDVMSAVAWSYFITPDCEMVTAMGDSTCGRAHYSTLTRAGSDLTLDNDRVECSAACNAGACTDDPAAPGSKTGAFTFDGAELTVTTTITTQMITDMMTLCTTDGQVEFVTLERVPDGDPTAMRFVPPPPSDCVWASGVYRLIVHRDLPQNAGSAQLHRSP